MTMHYLAYFVPGVLRIASQLTLRPKVSQTAPAEAEMWALKQI